MALKKKKKKLKLQRQGLVFLHIWIKGSKVQGCLDNLVSSWWEKILGWFYSSLCFAIIYWL